MELNEQDREWVKLTAAEIVRSVSENLFRQHIDSCPHGKKFDKSKAMLIAFCLGAGLAGGTAGNGIMQLLGKALGG